MTDILDDSDNVIAHYSYDELSRRTLMMLGNDANAVYVYDLANRLTSLTNNLPDANDTMSFDYTMDKVGNRLTMTVDGSDVHRYACVK